MNTTDKFNWFVPIDTIEKGTDANGKETMIIGGVVSDETTGEDLDGDIIKIDGMDLSPLMNKGFVNWNHLGSKDPSMIIGEPISFEKKNGKLIVKSKLYPESEMAKKVFDLAKTLSKGSSSRKLGYSVEGGAIDRDPIDKRVVRKSIIAGLAVAPHPKCKGTGVIITKGEVQYESQEGSDMLVDIVNDYGDHITIDKSLKINVEKAMEAGSITGRETTDQSLTQEPLKEGSIEGNKKKKKKKEVTDLTKAELYTYLIDNYKMDSESCRNFYSLACNIQNNLN